MVWKVCGRAPRHNYVILKLYLRHCRQCCSSWYYWWSCDSAFSPVPGAFGKCLGSDLSQSNMKPGGLKIPFMVLRSLYLGYHHGCRKKRFTQRFLQASSTEERWKLIFSVTGLSSTVFFMLPRRHDLSEGLVAEWLMLNLPIETAALLPSLVKEASLILFKSFW